MFASDLYLGTDDGVRVLDGTELTVTEACLHDTPVRDIAVDPDDPDTAWAGCALGGWGLHRTDDGWDTVDAVGFEEQWVWGVDRLPDGHLYVGTEPPGLFRSGDGGEFTELDGVHDVAGREDWTFWYDPFEAGHVHGVTAHPDRPRRLFGAVEIGGVLRSEDGGDTWDSRLRGEDVHRFAVDPEHPDCVVAATETGIYESTDAGSTWAVVEPTEGLYVKHLAFDSTGTLYAPAAGDMGDTDVRLFVHDDDWARREPISDASVLAFAIVDDTLVLQEAGESGRLLGSTDCGDTWTALGPSLPRLRCIRAASETR